MRNTGRLLLPTDDFFPPHEHSIKTSTRTGIYDSICDCDWTSIRNCPTSPSHAHTAGMTVSVLGRLLCRGAFRPLAASNTITSTSSSCSSSSINPGYPSHISIRPASLLASLSDNPGAYNKRIRRGRGPSSGKGKTSGRGHKGQKQHGKVPAGFTGGQTKEEVVHGKRGFENQCVDPFLLYSSSPN